MIYSLLSVTYYFTAYIYIYFLASVQFFKTVFLSLVLKIGKLKPPYFIIRCFGNQNCIQTDFGYFVTIIIIYTSK